MAAIMMSNRPVVPEINNLSRFFMRPPHKIMQKNTFSLIEHVGRSKILN